MSRFLPLTALLLLAACAPPAATLPSAAATDDVARWERQAQNVTITRDEWGIAHVRGRTDADAIFGMVYAQAEDDFNRVETNFINAMGRLAEAEGEGAIWQDLRMKLFIQPDSLRAMYAASPPWLQQLMNAWADGLNYYLHTHPQVRPRVITRFEPWMALSFSEGSIGGDIERVSLRELEAFYGRQGRGSGGALRDREEDEPRGSNGIAIAPQNTVNGNALLLINPHTTFFFRSELQVTSDEGLNVYGAATWGQFFIYQGFNERLGWMHTSTTADVVDEFLETVVERNGRFFYRYGAGERPLITSVVAVPYRTADGAVASRSFTVYHTHRGPVVREVDGRWVSVALMHKPVAALSQSYLRTKARTFSEFMEAMQLRANSSNNTVYADADGNIAHLYPQFVPRRDDRFDYTRPVDGSDPATDWQGEHALAELPSVVNPPTGWVQNTNNWPYTAAGAHSPRREQFPRYMDVVGENTRGVHALQLLEGRRDFTLASLIDAAYDPYLPSFAQAIPTLVAAYDALPPSDSLVPRLRDPVAALRTWDFRWGVGSVPTSLAVFWGEQLLGRVSAAGRPPAVPSFDYVVSRATPRQKLEALAAGTDRLTADFGTWRTPWGEINRFQRRTGDIVQQFSDAAPSIPVGFTSAVWGSLASFGARAYPGTTRRYGTSGNSFVAVVEFGDSVRARAVSAGGESGDPRSQHFNDQAERYAAGDLREVYFYPSQLRGRVARTYRPGKSGER